MQNLLKTKGELDLKGVNRNILNQRDVNSGYTLVHALSSSGLSVHILRDLYNELQKHMLMGKLVAKDRDGDMPLQSAIYSGANSDTIRLLLDFDSSKKVAMLENRNKANRSALESSLYMEDQEVFKLLLEQCIECNVLKHFTCLEVATNGKGTTTLLHLAVRERKPSHIRAYFDVCQKKKVKSFHWTTDEKGYTPWYYLMEYSTDEMARVKEFLGILEEYKIGVSKLVVNRNRENLLHKAYRYNKMELIQILEERSNSFPPDRLKRAPSDRKRTLEVDAATTCTSTSTNMATRLSRTSTQPLHMPTQSPATSTQPPHMVPQSSPTSTQPPHMGPRSSQTSTQPPHLGPRSSPASTQPPHRPTQSPPTSTQPSNIHPTWIHSLLQHPHSHPTWVRDLLQHPHRHLTWVRSLFLHLPSHPTWIRSLLHYPHSHPTCLQSLLLNPHSHSTDLPSLSIHLQYLVHMSRHLCPNLTYLHSCPRHLLRM